MENTAKIWVVGRFGGCRAISQKSRAINRWAKNHHKPFLHRNYFPIITSSDQSYRNMVFSMLE